MPNEKLNEVPRWWRSPAVLGVLLGFFTLIVFLPAIRHEFVNYDDPDYVTGNRRVLQGPTPANIHWAFTTGHASNWHPLTWISHMVDAQFFGENPAGHHFTSVLIHALNAGLLYWLLRRMTGSVWRSLMVAALFALHPLRVESVAWVSERKDVLSTLFFLLTLLAYATCVRGSGAGSIGTGAVEHKPEARPPRSKAKDAQPLTVDGPSQSRQLWPWYFLALGLFALGLMSKPMLVTVPFLLLLLDYWPLNRFRFGAGQGITRQFLRLAVEKIPFLALSILSSIVTFLVQREGGAVSSAIALDARLGNAVVAYNRYLGKFFWPADLSVLYPHPGYWPLWQVIGAVAVLVAISALVVWQIRKAPYLFTGWFWFLGMMVPVIGIVQVGIQSMADRYTYTTMIGVAMALVWGGTDLLRSRGQAGRWVGISALGIVLGFTAVTLRQIGYWSNSEALFRRAVQVTRDNYLAYNNLGYYLSNRGAVEEAIENYRQSLAINPNYEDALNNLGHALASQRKFTEAIPYYEAALRVRPNHVEVHNNYGNALSEVGKVDEAIGHYEFALKQKPDHADAHNNLGIALAMKGQFDAAIAHFREAIRFKPNYASAHSNLGNAYAVQGKREEAIREYQECLRLNPSDPQAHNNLGNVMAEQGNLAKAVEHYEQAIKLNSINPEAHHNLGLILLRLERKAEAQTHFQEALRLRPGYPEARRQLDALGK